MTDLPEPLTPPDCDLRDYTWSPVDWNRLLTSETWMLGTDAQKVAALTLWGKSWHQVPAGSLPANDRMLELLSERRDWARVKAHAMRGWVLCSDGRLYHPVVAEKANESWAIKKGQKQRTEAARRAKQEKRDAATEGSQAPPTAHVTNTVTDKATEPVAMSVTEDVTGSTLPNQTRPDLKKERAVLRTDAGASPDRTPADELWTKGLPFLRHVTGMTNGAARSFLGQLRKTVNEDCAGLLAIMAECEDAKPAEPKAWLMAAALARAGTRQPTNRHAESVRQGLAALGLLDQPGYQPELLQ